MRKPKRHPPRQQRRLAEIEEISLLDQWLESQKPNRGTNPLALAPPPHNAPVGRLKDGGFSPFSGVKLFRQLPISQKTKDGLGKEYVEMSEIQRASLPHSLCGRDILGAAKTGSGKTLAFIIPVIEKLYRARWGPEDGVGSIIISPTIELAKQLFDVLKLVGKYHELSSGLLIGGRKDVDFEKERVNSLNILVCTPGRLLQHMDETPNFDCSQLQILVLDEADRILDSGFRNTLDAILSQLPRSRQTLLFSATQTKSVTDLARVNLINPEYISAHAESVTATPEHLRQDAIIVPLDQKLSMLWFFIKKYLGKKIIVFLSSCKQVKFVYETFRKLRPGVPLKCLHGGMKQPARMATFLQFCEETTVLFSTDVASRGLDFPQVDWVVQVDCPEDIPSYIHRVGRTARFSKTGRSLLFLTPSESDMLTRLQSFEPKIPIKLKKPKDPGSISALLSSLLVKYPNLQQLAQRAFITYLKSIYKRPDKKIFDIEKLPIEDFALSLGLSVTPKVRFLKRKYSNNTLLPETSHEEHGLGDKSDVISKKVHTVARFDEEEDDILMPKESTSLDEQGIKTLDLATRILKKKKLKINMHRPIGTRVKYDEEGNAIAPLASIANMEVEDIVNPETVEERYKKLRQEMKLVDKEDKIIHRQRLRDKRTKEKMKLKRWRVENDEVENEDSELDENAVKNHKRSKIYFDDEDDKISDKNVKERATLGSDSISIQEQEALALKLLQSMHG